MKLKRRVVASVKSPPGSLDCASIPLREIDAPLRMTLSGDGVEPPCNV